MFWVIFFRLQCFRWCADAYLIFILYYYLHFILPSPFPQFCYLSSCFAIPQAFHFHSHNLVICPQLAYPPMKTIANVLYDACTAVLAAYQNSLFPMPISTDIHHRKKKVRPRLILLSALVATMTSFLI